MYEYADLFWRWTVWKWDSFTLANVGIRIAFRTRKWEHSSHTHTHSFIARAHPIFEELQIIIIIKVKSVRRHRRTTWGEFAVCWLARIDRQLGTACRWLIFSLFCKNSLNDSRCKCDFWAGNILRRFFLLKFVFTIYLFVRASCTAKTIVALFFLLSVPFDGNSVWSIFLCTITGRCRCSEMSKRMMRRTKVLRRNLLRNVMLAIHSQLAHGLMWMAFATLSALLLFFIHNFPLCEPTNRERRTSVFYLNLWQFNRNPNNGEKK